MRLPIEHDGHVALYLVREPTVGERFPKSSQFTLPDGTAPATGELVKCGTCGVQLPAEWLRVRAKSALDKSTAKH